MFDLRYFLIPAVAAAGLMAGTSSVHAATACSSGTPTEFVDGTDGNSANGEFVEVTSGNANLMCEFADIPGSDNEDNVDTFFSTNWSDQDKVETDDDGFGTDGFLTISDDGNGDATESGLWEISDAFWDLYDTALLLFKDGNADPGDTVAYKVTRTGDGDVEGTYTSMFFNEGTSTTKDGAVSHISLYGFCSDPQSDGSCGDDPPGGGIPLPAGLPLLLTAIGAGGILRMCKRKTA